MFPGLSSNDCWPKYLYENQSKVDDSGKTFHSVLQEGTLSKDLTTGKYAVEFGDTKDLQSGHSEAGRGMELSELIMWNE